MRVLLVNVDCRWNLALRRLYSWHENHGDEVEMVDLGFGFYPHSKRSNIDGSSYDRVYVSNIFEANAERVKVFGCADVRRGGSAQGLTQGFPKRSSEPLRNTSMARTRPTAS